jgi:CheY-like chemotaxis protein
MKVLIIEDRRENVVFIANNILKPRGYEVISAMDGPTGLSKAIEESPDLLIVDLKLPGMDGLEVLRQLKEQGINIPSIIMTFHGTEETVVRAIRLGGVKDYLTKPFTVEEMLAALDRAFETDEKLSLSRKSRQESIFQNPYVAGPPIINPKMFYGRQSDLKKIVLLLTHNFVMLVGRRRIGKTSLLHQLVHYLPKLKKKPERYIPTLVNMEGTPEVEFFHTIMEEIINTCQGHLSATTIGNLSFEINNVMYSPRTFSRDLQTILKDLHNTIPKPSRLVLMLDEMDTLNSYSLQTQSQLRRIFQRFANTNLSVIVAGVKLQKHWAGESSPFYNMFVPVTLTPFPESEAHHLITEPVNGIYAYNDEAIYCVLEASLGLPHRIQQLCLEVINHVLATFRGPWIIKEDVDSVLQTIQWLDEEITGQDQNLASAKHVATLEIELKRSREEVTLFAQRLYEYEKAEKANEQALRLAQERATKLEKAIERAKAEVEKLSQKDKPLMGITAETQVDKNLLGELITDKQKLQEKIELLEQEVAEAKQLREALKVTNERARNLERALNHARSVSPQVGPVQDDQEAR